MAKLTGPNGGQAGALHRAWQEQDLSRSLHNTTYAGDREMREEAERDLARFVALCEHYGVDVDEVYVHFANPDCQ